MREEPGSRHGGGGTTLKTIVWLKNDLRLVDSRSMALALSTSSPEDVVVARARDGTPGHVRPTARRLRIETERFEALRPILETAGVALLDASASEAIVPLAVRLGATRVISNIEVSEDVGYASDLAVARALRASGIEFVETGDQRIARGSRPAPDGFITSARDLAPLRFAGVPEPIADLRAYLDRLPSANYRRDMWTPGPDAQASSRLSIDVACGALSGAAPSTRQASPCATPDPPTARPTASTSRATSGGSPSSSSSRPTSPPSRGDRCARSAGTTPA
jgi:hypothetical protein